ncbi:hypothetical protein NL676_008115 [Syzygium grande]|nr:hypothetical protein NL676_008115 [Syzygium grande]
MVAGDVMHPMTLDLGQGGCSALEDAVALGRHLGDSISKHGKLVTQDIGFAMERYAKERRLRAATLVTASYLSGWVQQEGSSRLARFLRDVLFYGILLARVITVLDPPTSTTASISHPHGSPKPLAYRAPDHRSNPILPMPHRINASLSSPMKTPSNRLLAIPISSVYSRPSSSADSPKGSVDRRRVARALGVV